MILLRGEGEGDHLLFFFPKEYDAFYCMYKENLPDPRVAMNVLNTFLISKKPLRFIISETGVNVPVFIVSLNSSFRGGRQEIFTST